MRARLDWLPGARVALKTIRKLPRLSRWKTNRGAAHPAINPTGSAPLCVLPWMHAQVQTTGEVHLCCIANHREGALGNVHREPIHQIFQSNRINAIRQEMLRGTWPADCAGCRQREAMGIPSHRQAKNEQNPVLFEQLVAGEAPAPRIRSLDLRLNNVCNFKCRFCNGFESNRWFDEHNLVFPESPVSRKNQGFDRVQSFWDDLDRDILPDLNAISIAGGEPLIIDAHYRLLERLISAGRTDVQLNYNTNLSHLKFKHWDVIDLWNKFPRVMVNLSLDGVGEKGEYIRDGLDFGKWAENARRLQREAPHVRRNLHFVVCIFNVIDFPEHFNVIAENCFVEPGWITLTFLDNPAYLSAQVLTPDLKAKAVRNLRYLLSSNSETMHHARPQIEALIGFLLAEDLYETHSKEFAEKTSALDRIRGQNASDLFPDLAPMLVPHEACTPC